MGTSLTGTKPKDTYDSLIKVGDNGPLSGTAKYLSDGLGNDSVLALSTSKVGIGTATPAYNLHINAATDSRIIITDSAQGSTANDGTYIRQSGVNSSIVNQENGTLQFGTNNSFAQTILANGNVGIGTSSPATRLDVKSTGFNVATFDSTFGQMAISFANSATTFAQMGSGISVAATGGATDLGFGTAGQANASIIFATGAGFTERFRITNNGVTFNGDTAAANSLSDYEEGTWTMGVAFGGASVGATYAFNTGRYTKIGRQVTAVGFLGLSSKGTSTGSATITGLPFTIAAGTSNYSASTFAQMALITYTGQMSGYGTVGNTTILLQTTSAGSLTSLTDTNFANNSELMVTFTYFV